MDQPSIFNSIFTWLKPQRSGFDKPPAYIKEIFAKNQETRLLSLPQEVRKIIFEFAMESRHIQVNCSSSTQSGLTYRSTLDHDDDWATRYNYWRKSEEPLAPIEPIRLVCRQAYFDTFLSPYSINIFSFLEEKALDLWQVGLYPEQRNAVKRLLVNPESHTVPKFLRPTNLFATLRVFAVAVPLGMDQAKVEELCEQFELPIRIIVQIPYHSMA